MGYTTKHNTSERTMTHDFGNGYELIVDFNFGRIIKVYDNEIKDSFPIGDMTLSEYERILVNFHKAIKK